MALFRKILDSAQPGDDNLIDLDGVLTILNGLNLRPFYFCAKELPSLARQDG